MDTPDPKPASQLVPDETRDPEPAPEIFRQQPPPSRIPWRLRDLAFFIAFALFALVLCSFVTYLGYEVLRPIFRWHASLDTLRSNAFFNIALQSLLYVLILGYVYILVVVHYQLPFWQGLGWRPLTGRQVFRFALLGALLSFGAEFALARFPDKGKFPLEQLFSSPAAVYALAVFAIAIAAPVEELLFRGVLFAFFERQVGLRFAIGGTALLFAALHIQEYQGAWNHALLILAVGLFFSLVRGLSGSLAPSVVLHVSYNATQMVVLFFASHHFRQNPSALL